MVASRDAGGRWASRPLAPSPARRSRPGPSAPAPGAPGGRGRRRRRPGRRAATSAGGVEPAAQRLLLGAQVGAGRGSARCRAAPPRRSPPSATGSAPGVATTIAGRSRDRRADPVAAGACRTGTPGKARPSSSAVRALAEHRRAQAAVAALGARPAGVRRCRTSGSAAARSGPGSASGPEQARAAGRGPAALAGQAGRVAGARASAPAPGPLGRGPDARCTS